MSESNKTLTELNATVDRGVRRVITGTQTGRSVTRMVIILVVAFAIFAILQPRVFLNPLNLQNLGVATPEIGVLAIAMMLAMLAGGIDLSVVSIANLSAITVVMVTSAMAGADATLPAIGLALLVGMLAGAVNGFLIGVVRITPILATLGTMQIFNGIGIVLTGGSTLYGVPAPLTAIGKGTLAGVPLLFVVLIVVAILVALFLNRTPLGVAVRLEGSNSLAAKYSGISSRSVLIGLYLVTGLLAAVAGLLIVARNPSASADYGSSYLLLLIVIAVLGGTNPDGGTATVTGVVLAALVLQIVSSGFNALRLSAYEYQIAQGVILIVVLILDQVRLRRRRPKSAPARKASA
ncbi:ABC transporter permease [Microbacterium lacticum]